RRSPSPSSLRGDVQTFAALQVCGASRATENLASWFMALPKGCVGSVACSPRRLFQKSGPGADMPALKRQIDARRLKRRSSGKPLISKEIQAEVTSRRAFDDVRRKC